MADSMRLLVTGGAGFIGSNYIRTVLAESPSISVLNFDALTYAGNLENLAAIAEDPRYRFIHGDITDARAVDQAFSEAEIAFDGPIDAVVHFAAESHVDRSIEDPGVFLRTNVLGTETMLRVARQRGVARFVHVSTDEVYGSLTPDDPPFSETTPLAPNSPYAASKASSDFIARAYWHTFGFPVLTTRCSNNYGPYQFPEKLIPLMIANALDDKPLPVYGDGMNVRDWIHVEDHVRGVHRVLLAGQPGDVYNLGGHAEVPNLEIIRTILRVLGKPERLITFVTDRPGHDRRYAMDTRKVERELGWAPRYTLTTGLEQTIRWYLANQAWMSRVRSGAYQTYYARMYQAREQWVETL